jgi:hypothetical protein
MSLTRDEYLEILGRLKVINNVAKKIWKKRHYKWGNEINWQTRRIKEMLESVVGQTDAWNEK